MSTLRRTAGAVVPTRHAPWSFPGWRLPANNLSLSLVGAVSRRASSPSAVGFMPSATAPAGDSGDDLAARPLRGSGGGAASGSGGGGGEVDTAQIVGTTPAGPPIDPLPDELVALFGGLRRLHAVQVEDPPPRPQLRVVPPLTDDQMAEVVACGCYRCGHEASAADPCDDDCPEPLPWSLRDLDPHVVRCDPGRTP